MAEKQATEKAMKKNGKQERSDIRDLCLLIQPRR